MTLDLRKLRTDPKAFRESLVIEVGGKLRRMGDVIEPWQERDFAALDSAWQRVAGVRPSGGFLRAYLQRGRGHSKTTDVSVMALYALWASPRRIVGVAAAKDRDQAKLLRGAAERIAQLNPWLLRQGKEPILEIQRDAIVNKFTGSELQFISSDVAGSWGLTPDFIICDEWSVWPDDGLWQSLFSAAPKRPGCLMMLISNAGNKTKWNWKVFQAIQAEPDWYVSVLDGPQASWITPRRLEEQRRLLHPVEFERVWMNRWTAGGGDALRADDIDAAMCLSGPPTDRNRGLVYVAGIDLGLTRDASALVVVAKNIGYWDEPKPAKPKDDPRRRVLERFGFPQADIASPDEGTPRFISGDVKIRLVHCVSGGLERGHYGGGGWGGSAVVGGGEVAYQRHVARR